MSESASQKLQMRLPWNNTISPSCVQRNLSGPPASSPQYSQRGTRCDMGPGEGLTAAPRGHTGVARAVHNLEPAFGPAQVGAGPERVRHRGGIWRGSRDADRALVT